MILARETNMHIILALSLPISSLAIASKANWYLVVVPSTVNPAQSILIQPDTNKEKEKGVEW